MLYRGMVDRLPACLFCKVQLLRRVGSDITGYWCPQCGAEFTPMGERRHHALSVHRENYARPPVSPREGPMVPYTISEQRDGSAKLWIGGHSYEFSAHQLEHLAQSASAVARWGFERMKLLAGTYEWVATNAGPDRMRVRVLGEEGTMVPMVVRASQRCTACDHDQPPKSRMWRGEGSGSKCPQCKPDYGCADWKGHDSYRTWRNRRICDPCMTAMQKPVGLIAIHGGKAAVG